MRSMCKVMLVDDERIILEGIAKLVKWNEAGTSLVATARHGAEAIEKIPDVEPEIIVADIRMPVMDGLELVKSVKQQWPAIDFVLLSGFRDFDYARQAMTYGIRHYLLKPCNETTILKALSELTKSREEQELSKPIRSETQCPVKKIEQLVHAHFGNPELTLQWIATHHLHMNADYLGKLFKQKKAERFSAYVTRVRIEKVKVSLATDAHARITELADACGFGDNPHYLSQVFKRETGYTPTEYKKTHAHS
ncbi:response regulator transcription factor [Aureibacillus halotolerans]|uniref:Helix-turn-helix protein n=1 Tax=Aureibacillus halotolerans TaxID=1508390 RepID=A0A4V3D638_9BACI|nr:response regulator [Aureibacillus halotolerans]TDQ42377.1 helix-turn-helix protein [Aureibacillus halotolerans]